MEQSTGKLKIAGRMALIVLVTGIFIAAGFARGNNPGITFATGGIDLKIDSRSFYNGVLVPASTWALKNLVPTADHFFNFSDIKPGDSGRTIISAHVDKAPAFLCLDFTNLKNLENGVNEPESLVDPTSGAASGELAKGTEFFGWLDNGDGIFKPGEKILFGTSTQAASTVLNNTSYVIGDSRSGGSCKVNDARYVGIAWCAGDLVVNLATGAMSCNGAALGNEAQTDSFSVDVSIVAQSSDDNPKFTCGGGITPPVNNTGGISGMVYNDLNKNSKKNTGEPGLSGWTINLYSGAGWGGNTHKPPIKVAISDSNGNYAFNNLADGIYSVEEIIKSGWDQLTSDYKSISIQHGAVIPNIDFGDALKTHGRKN